MVGAALAACPQVRSFCSSCLPAQQEQGVGFAPSLVPRDAEKLTSEATAVNGITAPIGATLASLSFPLQHSLIILLSSSLYLFVLFYCHFSLTTPNRCSFSF